MSSTILELGALNGLDGFRLAGFIGGQRVGNTVSVLGDIDGDGFADVAVAGQDYVGDGLAFIVFGAAAGFPASIDLTALDGADGFALAGLPTTDGVVVGLGDVNADGFDDFFIGGEGDDLSGAASNEGVGRVVFGRAAGFGASFDVSSLDAADGFTVPGAVAGEFLGKYAGRAGDVNGDGFADLILGGPDIASDLGGGFVVFGGDDVAATVGADTLDGSNGFRFLGAVQNGNAGDEVDGAGDVNGDGFDDLIIAAPFVSGGPFRGEAFVLFGRADGFTADVDLAALDGADGFRIPGVGETDNLGSSVSAAGDVNGDGLDDVIVAAYGVNDYAGQIFVIFGKTTPFAATFGVAGLDGADGFSVLGVDQNDLTGIAVSEAGDFNGDGLDDILIGAVTADPDGRNGAGEAYVVFGRADGFPASIDLAALDASAGVLLNGVDPRDFAGRGLGGGGDVNGDGFEDIVIGARDADYGANGLAGESYVVFGGDFSGVVTHQGTAAGETVTGDGQDNVIVLGQGDDTSNAGGGADVVRGGEGDDVVSLGDGDDRAFGGTGDDVLIGGAGDDALYGESGDDLLALGQGPGAIAFGGAGDDVIHVGTGDNQVGVRVHGGAGLFDTVQIVEPGFASLDLYGALTGVEQIRLFPGGFFVSDDVGRTIFGGNLAETLQLGAGDDVALAGAGDDEIDGADGDDVLLGDAGDDEIRGGLGLNRLTGGAGADRFILTPGVENEIIQDFTVGEDVLDLSLFAISNFATQLAPVARDINGKAVIDLESGERITLAGLTVAELDNSILLAPSANRESSAPTIIDLANLDGADGFRMDGINVQDRLGGFVAGVGDFNGDGFDDVAASRPRAVDGDGDVFLVFGRAGGFSATVDLGALDGADGAAILSPENAIGFGSGLAGGDFNGDGVADILTGAYGLGDGPNVGGAFVAFGAAGFGDATVSLAALDGGDGVRFDGVDSGDAAGRVVAAVGDVNGDGVADFLIGAQFADISTNGNEGESYVVFGRTGGFPQAVALTGLDGADGFRLEGAIAGSFSGRAVGDAGDLNGDGLADFVVASGGVANAGEAFVVFGRKDGVASLSLGDLDGADGFRFDGAATRDYAGRSVAAAGDLNGDGFGDLVIGAYGADQAGAVAGQAYVLFGSDAGFAPVLTVSDLDGTNGFTIDGIDSRDKMGSGVDGVGDFNGDGLDDLLVFSREADFGSGGDRGEAYVLFGRTSGFAEAFNISTLDATEGVRIRGVDAYDFQLAVDAARGVGDVNGDGFDDLILGAPYDDPGDVLNLGSAYVVFGGDFSGVVTHQGTAAGETVTGNGAANVMALGQGDDVFNAGGGDDVVRGGAGRDTGALGGGDDRAFGGSGDDVLNGGLGDDVLYGGDGVDRLLLGRGADAAFGGGGTDLFFERADQLGAGDRIDGGEGGNDTLVVQSTGLLDLTSLDLFAGVERVRVAANQEVASVDLDIVWTGRAGSETFALGAGQDIVRAGGAQDIVHGGAGDDLLLGQGGDDVLQGGAGFDRLVGSIGADRFVFEAGGGVDIVLDFEDGVDTLDVRGLGVTDFSAVEPLIRDIAGKAVIDFAGGERVVLNGVAAADLDASDFITALTS